MRRALLALLLAQVNHPVPVSEIVDVLWGEGAPDSAVNVVRRHVGVLRRLLDASTADANTTALVRGSGGYRLQLDTAQLDLLQFKTLRTQAQRHREAGDLAAGVDLLLDAIGLWRGPVASGIPAHIRAHPMFVRIDREYLAAVKDAAAAAIESGPDRVDRTLLMLRRAAAAHPLDESLHARLITALAVTGHHTEARHAYEVVSSRLREELGLDPGPELMRTGRNLTSAATGPGRRAVAEAFRTSLPDKLDNPASAAVKPEPDVLRVEKPDTADMGTAWTRPAQLPPDLGVFSGRHTELALAHALLPADDTAAPPVVIGAISGMAGIGKTTLAVHWAHKVAPRYPDGQLYTDLRGFDPGGGTASPAQVLRAFLDALGVPQHRIPVSVDAQAALYRSLLAGKRVLVVLDNARDTEQVRQLLPGAAGCLTVVTSRNYLSGLVAEGARPLALGVLDAAESHDFLARRLGEDRLAAEPRSVEDIVALCGGLPLALAIVSARTAVHPEWNLAAIATELREGDSHLTVLSAGDPATDIQTVFSWSYRVLTDTAARLFRLLALHPGPDVSVAAAACLLGVDRARARPVLSELTTAHLLTERFPGRFVCHDLLRVYAGELLGEQDDTASTAAARQRLLEHLLHSAHRADALLAPHRERITLAPPAAGADPVAFTGREEAANWLETERAVILAAVRDDGAQTHCASLCWRLATTVELHLDRHGRWQEQLALQSAALEAAERAADLSGRAHAHRALGFVHGRLENPAEAVRHLESALEVFAVAGDPAGRARTHRYLAFQANKADRHDEALTHYAAAHAFYREAGHLVGQAQVFNEVGWTHILRGDHAQALLDCRQAIDLHQHLDDQNGEAAAWDSLGYAHHHLGRHREAIGCYQHALSLYRRLHDTYLEADTLVHIGDSFEARGDLAQADASWRQALEILENIAHPDAETLRKRLVQNASC
ncbi:BTAD domain-containing putative transcriptional regulator [Streptomyces sp. NPDC005474]|uniref:AfsR/SARP family transcriptional regulator n=1 Tax=Streptomyces sp. NPDC005474 TaxID=3154878 RepID=UPI0034517CF3